VQAEPVIGGVGLALVGQAGNIFVRYIKEVAQHRDRIALLSFPEQCCNWNIKELAEQVKQGAFDRSDCMYGDSQVKSLVATARAIPVSESFAHAVQDMVPVAKRLAFNQFTGIFQCFADFFPAWHFADTDMSETVRQDKKIAREKRTMSPAQVQQHTVAAGYRNDLYSLNAGRRRRRPSCFV
jgi:hypothetical protein